MNIFGPVSQGLGIANIAYGFYKDQQTKKYRESVLAGITAIENQIADFEKEFKHFEKIWKFYTVWAKGNNPLHTIKSFYEDFEENPYGYRVTSTDAKTIDHALNSIHDIFCGEGGYNSQPIIKLYIDILSEDEISISKLEMAYAYFTYVFNFLLKGYSILGTNPKAYLSEGKYGLELLSYYEKWHWLFTKGAPVGGNIKPGELGSSIDSYLNHPFLEYIGKITQNVINIACKDSDFIWAGRTSKNGKDEYYVNKVGVGGHSDVPDNHAVVGFDFHEDGEGALGIIIWYAMIKGTGYADMDTYGMTANDCHEVIGFRQSNSNGPIYCDSYISIKELIIPNGHLIMDIRWKRSVQPGGDDYFYLEAKYAPMKLLLVEEQALKNQILNTYLVPDKDMAVWSGYAGIDVNTAHPVFENGHTGPLPLEHWVNYSNTPPNSVWNLPITGVQFYNHSGDEFSRAVCRTSIHSDCFKEQRDSQ